MAFDKWFFDLYERNYALLYRVGRVFLAYDPVQESFIEDQIQEAFMRAWQKRSLLKHHPNPDGWLVECFRKCLVNACRKRNRERKHRVRLPDADESPDTLNPVHLSPDEYVKLMEEVNDARLLALATDRLAHFEKAGIVSEADVLSELGITEEDLVDAGKVVLE